jgi:hypothetical protein
MVPSVPLFGLNTPVSFEPLFLLLLLLVVGGLDFTFLHRHLRSD